MSDINELINKMNPKKKPEDLNMNIGKTKEKFKPTIKEVEIDYYKILGVKPSNTALEIKRAYQEKLRKLNPNKIEQTPENKAKYALVREAGDVLTDPIQKKVYDMQKKMDESPKDFKSQQESFKNFIKLQEQSATDEDLAIAKLNFERGIQDLNRKHGYDSKQSDAYSKDEYDRRIEDMMLHRQQEEHEIEMENDNLFAGRKFVPSEFNKLFEQQKKNENKRKNKSGLATLGGDISAFNDFGGDTGMGTSIENYDSLYAEGDYNGYNDSYASISKGFINIKKNDDSDDSDDISLDSPDPEDDSSYDNHTKGNTQEQLAAAMERMMAERNDQDKQFEQFKQSDYGSAMDDKYGISSQMGFMIGNDKFGHQKTSKRNIKEETLRAYKQLTEK